MLKSFAGLIVLALVAFPEGEIKKINLDLKDVPVGEAIMKVVELGGLSAALAGQGLPEEPRVTLQLRNVDVITALRMVCRPANLGLEADQTVEGEPVLVITRRPLPPTVTVGGKDVPVIAATTLGDQAIGPGFPGVTIRRGVVASEGAPRENRPSFFGDDRLVDLDVKDVPLSEVAGRLSWTAKLVGPEPLPFTSEASLLGWYDLLITAADSVKDYKVTAKIAKWPLGQVLDMLMEQANLACTVENPYSPRGAPIGGPRLPTRYRLESDPETGEVKLPPPPSITVHLVPRPELSVSGVPRASLPPLDDVFRTYVTAAKDAQAQAQRAMKSFVVAGLRQCPKCQAAVTRPDWKFCPKCGAELPEAKVPAGSGVKQE